MATPSQRVKKLLKWIEKNPGKFGIDVPADLKPAITLAEAGDFITYSRRSGWRLTAKGQRERDWWLKLKQWLLEGIKG